MLKTCSSCICTMWQSPLKWAGLPKWAAEPHAQLLNTFIGQTLSLKTCIIQDSISIWNEFRVNRRFYPMYNVVIIWCFYGVNRSFMQTARRHFLSKYLYTAFLLGMVNRADCEWTEMAGICSTCAKRRLDGNLWELDQRNSTSYH